MSVRFAIAAWLGVLLAPARPAVAQISLDAVLQSVGAYLAQYEQRVSAVVAEENYLQEYQGPLGSRLETRRLKSDVLVLTDPVYGWVTFRDVYEVDGHPVRDRDQRLAGLFANPSATSGQQARAITEESSRLNLNVPGVSVNRSINVPIAALLYFRPDAQARSKFTLDRVATVNGRAIAVVAFEEQTLPRIIRSPTNLAMRGHAWIDTETGRVIRTNLTFNLDVPAASTRASIDVVYAEEPRSQLWLPSTMNERYSAIRYGQSAGVLTAKASYSHFRLFAVDVGRTDIDLSASPK